MVAALSPRQQALVEIGAYLRARDYRFVTPTPETHRRVVARGPGELAGDLRDVFGWSRAFVPGLLDPALLRLGTAADILAPTETGAHVRSRVRFSTLTSFAGEHLFVHSAYPTTSEDAVFFGPDSYRFAALLGRTVWKARRLIDVGCGSGVGGLVLASRAQEVVLADVNPHALAFAAVNVALASLAPAAISVQASDVLAQVEDPFDVVVANPPYLADEAGRLYRDGGGALGLDLAIRITSESLSRLAPGGQLVLYTGTPVIGGRPVLRDLLEPVLDEKAAAWTWEELDPDVFGDELERSAYANAERIAVVALLATVG